MNLFEIESIGIYNSNISRPYTDISKNRATSSFELELPLESGGTSYIESESEPITDKLFICAKPGQIRHTKFPFKCYYIHLQVSDNDLHSVLTALPCFIKIKAIDVYLNIFEELHRYCNTGIKQDEIMCQSLVLKLIYKLYRETVLNTEKGSKVYNSAVTGAIKYIIDNLTEDLTLEKVAKHVSFSPIHFHNSFKKATGKTLHAYIEEERIKKSINLMLTTDMTLTQIAYNSGFSSQSYYSYVFKRRMNTTPRKYIQNINNNYKI